RASPVGEPQLGRVLGARAVALQPAEHDAVDRPVVEQPADRPVPMVAGAGLLGPPARAPGAVAVQPGLRGFDLRPGGVAAPAVRAVDAAAQGPHPGRGPPGPPGRGGRAVPACDLEHPLLGHAVGLLPVFGAPQLLVVRHAPTARLRLRQAPVLRAELRIGLGGLHAQNHSSMSSGAKRESSPRSSSSSGGESSTGSESENAYVYAFSEGGEVVKGYRGGGGEDSPLIGEPVHVRVLPLGVTVRALSVNAAGDNAHRTRAPLTPISSTLPSSK